MSKQPSTRSSQEELRPVNVQQDSHPSNVGNADEKLSGLSTLQEGTSTTHVILVQGIANAGSPGQDEAELWQPWLSSLSLWNDNTIQSYHYDIVSERPSIFSKDGLKQEATRLLDSLGHYKDNETRATERRYIFVALDIGGILVKQSLILASMKLSTYGNLDYKTCGLVFASCPHRASTLTQTEDYVAALLSLNEAFTCNLVSKVTGLAQAIDGINREFLETKCLIRATVCNLISPRIRAIKTGNYKETVETDSNQDDKESEENDSVGENETCQDSMEREGFSTPSSLASPCLYFSIPFELVFETQVSYEDLIRGPRDQRESTLAPNAKDEMSSALQDAQKTETDADLHCLALSQASPLYPPALPPLKPLTHEQSDMILGSPPYKEWLNQRGTTVLHICGTSGVSTISRRLNERLGTTQNGDSNLQRGRTIFFEFNRRDIRFNSIKTLLATIIATLVSRFGHNLGGSWDSTMREIYNYQSWSVYDLQQILWLLQPNDGTGEVTIFISRLDNCDESWLWFVRRLGKMTRRHEKRLAWIISSEGDEDIKSNLSEWPTLDLDQLAGGDVHGLADGLLAQVQTTLMTSTTDAMTFSSISEISVRPLGPDELTILTSPYNGADGWAQPSAAGNEEKMQNHARMAQVCLRYLARPEIQEQMRAFCECNVSLTRAVHFTDRSNLIFYATSHWPTHYRLSETYRPFQDAMNFLNDEATRNTWAEVQYVLANPATRLGRAYLTPVPLMAMHGLDDLVLDWMSRERNSKFFHADLRLALNEAMCSGNISTARLVLPIVDADPTALSDAIVGAARLGSQEEVNELVQRASKMEEFPWPSQLLHRLAFLGIHQAAETLLDDGVTVEQDDGSLGIPPLHHAARYGHLETINVMLKAEVNINQKSKDGGTALSRAACNASPETLRLLLEAGADIATPNHKGATPLMKALAWGYIDNFQFLLEAGADPDYGKDGVDDPLWASKPLVYCAYFGLVEETKLLLKHKVNINCSLGALSALYLAVDEGHVEVAELLLEAQADPNENPIGYDLLLIRAVSEPDEAKAISLTKLLLDHEARIDEEDNSSSWRPTALTRAAGTDNTELVKLLIERGANVNHTKKGSNSPLFVACWSGETENVRQLIKAGAVINEQRENDEWLPAHASYDNHEIMQILLENGADPTLLSNRENCLHLAIRYEKSDVVKVLLDHRPKLDLEVMVDPPFYDGDDDYTALSIACSLGNAGIVRQLLEADANRNHQTKLGKRPLDISIEVCSLAAADVLLEYRTPIDYTDEDGNTPLHRISAATPQDLVKRLVNAGINPSVTNNNGVTPLRIAVATGNTDVAKYLLSKNPNFNCFLNGAPSLVHLACKNGDLTTLKLLADNGVDIKGVESMPDSDGLIVTAINGEQAPNQELLEYLVKTVDADINARGSTLEHPVNAACAHKYLPHLQFLLENQSDPNIEDSCGRRALHVACTYRDPVPELVDCLLSAGVQTKVNGTPIKDKLERTPVHFAASSGDWEIFSRVTELYDTSELTKPDADNWTPLFWALLTRDVDIRIIKHLIDNGADTRTPVITNNKKWSLLQLALFIGVPNDVIALLPQGRSRKRNAPRGMSFNFFCDSCGSNIYGINYCCASCTDYNLCFRCYPSRQKFHLLHDGDEWIETGPVYEENESSSEGGGYDADSGGDPDHGSRDKIMGDSSEILNSDDHEEDDDDDDDDDDVVDDDDDDDENDEKSENLPHSEVGSEYDSEDYSGDDIE
ncbi:ankyrin repeat-containing domain protein [Aspergillus filifer]